MTQRLARGSMPWPSSLTAPAAKGRLVLEAALVAGARLRITAWPRLGPDDERWLSLELESYPKGGRTTAHKQAS
jgi:hypothetical protein